MDINKSSTKWSLSFWIVNYLGWAGIAFVAYAFTPNIDGYKETNYFITSIWGAFFIGMLTTGLLRAYIKNIGLDDFGKQKFIKIFSAITVIALLYFALSFGLGYLMGYFGVEDVKVPEMYKVCNMIIKQFNLIFITKCTVSEISLQLNPIFFMRNFGHFRS